jgi:hypothetical protein
LDILIPSLHQQKYSNSWQENIKTSRFFGSHTKRGAQFPIIVRLEEENTVRITSMPVIAGLMTITRDGIIEGCNDIFVKYLFGFSQQELLKSKTSISQLLPQLPLLLKNLKRDDLLQPGLIINNIICRKLLQQEEMLVSQQQQQNKRSLTHTPNNQPLPILVAMHRDGTPLEVQLQLKLVETTDALQEEYALWISFDRELALKRYGHQHLISSTPVQQKVENPRSVKRKSRLVYSPTLTVIPPPTENKKVQQYNRSATAISTSRDYGTKKDSVLYDNAPPLIINSPPAILDADEDKEEIIYSAQTHSTTIDDYHILDSLGQGAYGLVKLAVKKNDPSQVKENCLL